MKILEMKLINFQGIKEKTIVFNGHDVTFRGDNATGKSTIANAWCWLIFGRPADMTKGWSPKTTDEDGNDLHNLENSAECKIQLDDGRICTIKKLMKEVYSTPKGTNNKQFKGNTVDYSIDGVPVKEKDYNAFIERIFINMNVAKLLTLPHFFSTDSKENKWDWKSRRSLLIEIAGELTDQDIIDSNDELEELNSILLKPGTDDQMYSVEEYSTKTKKQQSELQKRIERYPDLINEANLAMPEVSGIIKEDVEINIQVCKKAQDDLKEQITVLKNMNKDIDRENTILEIKAKERKAREEFLDSLLKHNAPIKEEIRSINDSADAMMAKIANLKRTVVNSENDVDYMSKRRNELLREYQTVAQSSFDDHAAVCPTCGREYEPSKVEELRAHFNLERSKKLEEINKRGQNVSKEAIKEVEELIKAKKGEIAGLEKEIETQRNKANELETQLIKNKVFEDTDEYHALRKQLETVQSGSVAADHTAEIMELKNKLSAFENEENELRTLLSRFETVERQKQRISELEASRKKDAEIYEQLEKGMYLCQMFTIAKVNAINENINKHFRTIKFKMFENNISNDGIKEICEVLVPCKEGLVPYSKANSAAKINAGLEIIDVLNKFYNITAPVFVDNAESVTRLNSIDSQVIRLVVDEKYKELTQMEG